MNKIFTLGIINLILIISFSSIKSIDYTAVDLDTEYQKIYDIVIQFQNAVNGFPQEYKGTLPASINDALASIGATYNKAKKNIQDRMAGKVEPTQLDRAIINNEVTNAVKDFAFKETMLRSQITPVQEAVNKILQNDDLVQLALALQKTIDDFIAYGTGVQADFQITKTTDIERIKNVRNLINILSTYDVAPISISLNAVENLLENAPSEIGSVLDQTVANLQTFKEEALAQRLTTTIAQQNLHLITVYSKNNIQNLLAEIEDSLSIAESKIQEIKRIDEAKKEVIAISKEKAEYSQRVRAFLTTISPLLKQYADTRAASTKVILNYARNSQYDTAAVEEIVASYQSYMQQFLNAYQVAQLPIRATDPANYLVLMLHSLSDFFNDLIRYQIQDIQTQYVRPSAGRDPYVALASEFAKRLNGSDVSEDSPVIKLGYSKQMTSIISSYFDQSASRFEKYFTQGHLAQTYSFFSEALNALLQRDSGFTDEIMQAAERFSHAIQSALAAFSQEEQKIFELQVFFNMALIYIKGAQESLQGIELDADNTSIVNQVIAKYQNAVKYYEKALPLSGKEGPKVDGFILTYKELYAHLTLALTQYSQATAYESSGNIVKALEFYEKASTSFLAGGDTADATIAQVRLNNLLARQKINEAKQYFTSFLNTYKSSLSNYLQYISVAPKIPSTEAIKSYEGMLTTMATVCNNALKSYSSAIVYYQAVMSVNIATMQSSVGIELSKLTAVVSILRDLVEAQVAMDNGNRQARQKNDLGLVRANQEYESALIHYNDADALYAAHEGLDSYVLIHPSLISTGQSWNYSMMTNRHIQRLYIELADTLQNSSMIALEYYAAASSKGHTAEALKLYAQTKLNSISLPQTTTLLTQVQVEIAEAKKLTDDAWLSTTTTAYTSNADTKWQIILNKAIALYYIQPEAVYDTYVNVLTDYSALYKEYVPAKYYPLIYSALLQYRLYMLYALSNRDKKAEALAVITTYAEQFFATGSSLLAAVNDQALISSAIENQNIFLTWYRCFKSAAIKEDLIVSEFEEYFTENKSEIILLLQEKLDVIADEITVEFVPAQRTLIFKDPIAKLADIYTDIADEGSSKNDHSTAQRYYALAIALYQELGQQDKAGQLEQKYTLAYARAVYNMLLPQGSVNVGGMVVPASYVLSVYTQKIPPALVKLFSDYTKMSAEEFAGFKIALAVNLYLYNKLLTINLDYFAIMSQLEQGKKPSGLNAAQEKVILDAQGEAEAFKVDLILRMQQDPNTLQLRYEETVNEVTYYLDETHKKIPADSQVPPLYKGYPSAYTYLYTPLILAAPPLEPGSLVKAGTKNFKPGNDPAFYAQSIESFGHMYIVEGNVYKAQFDLLQTCTDPNCLWEKLLQEKNNSTAHITPYVALYNDINTCFAKMIEYYNRIFITKTPPANTKPLFNIEAFPEYYTFLANSYKNAGYVLQNFLIGDPLSIGYYEKIMKIKELYRKAIEYYAYDPIQMDVLQRAVADIFKSAGNSLVLSGNYFGSITFFSAAENEYRKILAMPGAISLLEETFLRKIEVEFQGATANMVEYQKVKEEPMTIVLSNGQTEQILLDQLCQEYMAWLTENKIIPFDTRKLCKYEYFKAVILDAMIFYLNLGKELHDKLAVEVVEGSTRAASEWLYTFTQKNSIGLSSLTEAEAFIAKPNFAEIVMQGFQECKEMVLNADTVIQAKGYAAMSMWATKIFDACSYIYMDDYMGGIDDQAKVEILTHIQAEIEEIANPSKHYIGDICEIT